jgi:glycosyltransferase involved in cell wall biosynthesis
MKASVIIPTLNESDLLPGLLDRLDRQSFRDFEVIVADAGSKDGTQEICRSRGVVLVEGGMPAVGRNRGAAVARGERLFFLDADVMPPDDFLEKALEEMAAEESGSRPVGSSRIRIIRWISCFSSWRTTSSSSVSRRIRMPAGSRSSSIAISSSASAVSTSRCASPRTTISSSEPPAGRPCTCSSRRAFA